MNIYDEIRSLEYTDYDEHFWNAMRGNDACYNRMTRGLVSGSGTYALAPQTGKQYEKAIAAESLFRQIGTVIHAYGSDYRLYTKDCDDLAQWVPEGGQIPIYEGIQDFIQNKVDSHKLAVLVKMDEDFIHDNSFDFRTHLVGRLAENFGRAEDKAFVDGSGNAMPTGILATDGGAEVGVSTAALTYESVTQLFLSVKPKYRKKGVWLMNDETALVLRTLKDADGNSIWNPLHDTVLGKPVHICDWMPNIGAGTKPLAFGDFRYFWIVDRQPVSVRTLKEKFTLQDQVGYLGVEHLDAKLVRPDAVKVIEMTA